MLRRLPHRRRFVPWWDRGSLVFVSYRRCDSIHASERICDRLIARFGRRRVILDVGSIPPGADFYSYIDDVIPCCRALVAVIGPEWHIDPSAKGRRYLDDPQDLVGFELIRALHHGVPVFPVLIGGARPPAAELLPQDLRPLANLQCLEIRRNPDFHRDVDRLIEVL